MTALRELRLAVDLTQQEFATLINVPLNTFRTWDSGLRPTPPHLLQRATMAVTEHARNTELLSLDQLARELGVHQRTLRAAARTGRLNRLRRLRRRLRLTQHDLARRIGAANKAVVYQWESRQRRPSPVFWQRVEALTATKLGVRHARISSNVPAHYANRLPHGADTQPSAGR